MPLSFLLLSPPFLSSLYPSLLSFSFFFPFLPTFISMSVSVLVPPCFFVCLHVSTSSLSVSFSCPLCSSPSFFGPFSPFLSTIPLSLSFPLPIPRSLRPPPYSSSLSPTFYSLFLTLLLYSSLSLSLRVSTCMSLYICASMCVSFFLSFLFLLSRSPDPFAPSFSPTPLSLSLSLSLALVAPLPPLYSPPFPPSSLPFFLRSLCSMHPIPHPFPFLPLLLPFPFLFSTLSLLFPPLLLYILFSYFFLSLLLLFFLSILPLPLPSSLLPFLFYFSLSLPISTVFAYMSIRVYVCASMCIYVCLLPPFSPLSTLCFLPILSTSFLLTSISSLPYFLPLFPSLSSFSLFVFLFVSMSVCPCLCVLFSVSLSSFRHPPLSPSLLAFLIFVLIPTRSLPLSSYPLSSIPDPRSLCPFLPSFFSPPSLALLFSTLSFLSKFLSLLPYCALFGPLLPLVLLLPPYLRISASLFMHPVFPCLSRVPFLFLLPPPCLILLMFPPCFPHVPPTFPRFLHSPSSQIPHPGVSVMQSHAQSNHHRLSYPSLVFVNFIFLSALRSCPSIYPLVSHVPVLGPAYFFFLRHFSTLQCSFLSTSLLSLWPSSLSASTLVLPICLGLSSPTIPSTAIIHLCNLVVALPAPYIKHTH